MSNVTAFSDRLFTALNTPQCDLLTGGYLGAIFMFKTILTLIGLYIILKIVEKLALEPFLEWIKNKLYKKR